MPDYRLLKNCLEVAASDCRVSMTQLVRERGLRDFFIDLSEEENLTAEDIAVRALTTLCIRAGRLDGTVAIAVVSFLDKAVGCPVEDEQKEGQRVKDLLQILNRESRTETAYRQWYRSWYT